MKRKLLVSLFSLAMCAVLICGMCGCQVSVGSSKTKTKTETASSIPEKIVAKIKEECSLTNFRDISIDEFDVLYGVEKSDVAYFAGCISNDSLSKDEVIVIEAMDEGEASTIRDRLEEHYNKVLDECMEFLPEECEIVKKCSVVKDGIYVTLFISADAEKMEQIYKSYVK